MGPVLLVLGSCTSLQIGAALAVHLFALGGSTGTTFLRLGLAALVLLLVVRPRVRGWTRGQWRAAAALGLALAGMNLSFYTALSRIDLGTAVTIEFLGPLALAAATSRRARDLLWVGLALAGVGVLGVAGETHGDGLDPVGAGFALLAGAFWAGYIRAGARLGREVPGHGGLAVATAVATLVLAPVGVPGALRALQAPDGLLLALGTAVLASVVPYSLELAALRRLPQRTFGVLLSLEPVVASLAGWALLGQALTLLAALGIVLVVVASAGATWSAGSAARERARTPRPRTRDPQDGPEDGPGTAGPGPGTGADAPCPTGQPAPPGG
ncbi:inner membrane transporter RhtA [Kineococcus radiotolerans]|uniref:Inner membrane transporter RhtA n=1 Tax=Kineococcus radiotolerans TaxID=131568 RepID=A0A7W4TLS1_KINRA|nr:EamA family transporter [Kineococcus radiotolerans]MBB2901250.1 inner membrane transporter RhtA [Kineococcus radiotolerans]